VGVQTFCWKLAVEGFDERIIGRFSGAAEVQCDAVRVGPQVQVTRDELRSLIDTDRAGIAVLAQTRSRAFTTSSARPRIDGCFNMNAFCASVNFDAFIVSHSSQPANKSGKLWFKMREFSGSSANSKH
jgi:hypothetical protein